MSILQLTFVCEVCGRSIKLRFTPSIIPKCPSCGGITSYRHSDSQPTMVFCAKCLYEEEAYTHARCPRCNSSWRSFPRNVTESQATNPYEENAIRKQGISGGTFQDE